MIDKYFPVIIVINKYNKHKHLELIQTFYQVQECFFLFKTRLAGNK